jgi:hypothetical protein
MNDFGKEHWAMMISMSLLAIVLIFAVGFLLEWAAGRFA